MTIQSIGSSTARASDRVADPVAFQPATRGSAAVAETSIAVERAAKAPSPEQLKEAVANINKTLQTLGQDLEFSIDENSNRTIVRVVDQKTKEVIRQIPSPEALDIAKALDTVSGLLIKQTA